MLVEASLKCNSKSREKQVSARQIRNPDSKTKVLLERTHRDA